MNAASANSSHASLELAANTIRVLSAEAVEKAKSGHPGMPMGMAELGATLWLKYLKFHPKHPDWMARDRFVLSNGHGCMLLYSLLHLAGYDVTLDDLKSFRQFDSKTPGHPEFHFTPGVECTTGPLGQGISNAVGMAVGQKLLQTRYGTDLLKHNVWVFAGDGCLMEGVSSEACSTAGHLGLGNLKVVYDDNHISIAGPTSLAFTEDVVKRYEAYGWHVQRIDGHDLAAIDKAYQAALAVTDRPCLIAARTIIGKGAPHKANDSEVHGSPLGKDELAAMKKGIGWPEDKEFYVPEETTALFRARAAELHEGYSQWQEKYAGWAKSNGELAKRLEAQLKRTLPADLEDKLVAALSKDKVTVATRKLSETVLQAASQVVDALVGGSADLEPSTFTLIKGSTDVTTHEFSGKNLRFGVREHGMGAIMNGLSYYGGFIPYGSTFLCFADYMRPTIRLAAISHLQSLFIFTHDSIFLGEDGPTHQAVEHLNALRIIPNVHVYRPADGLETAMCYSMALARKDGPAVLCFSRQNVPTLDRPADFDRKVMQKGAYTIFESAPGKAPEIVFVATGSEVSLAIEAAKEIGGTKSCRVVSMPCCELFRKLPSSEKRALVPDSVKTVVVEAGASFGWASILELSPSSMLTITMDRFGASAPAPVLAEKFGFTAKSIVSRVKSELLGA